MRCATITHGCNFQVSPHACPSSVRLFPLACMCCRERGWRAHKKANEGKGKEARERGKMRASLQRGLNSPQSETETEMERACDRSLQSQTFHIYSLHPPLFFGFCFALMLLCEVFPSVLKVWILFLVEVWEMRDDFFLNPLYFYLTFFFFFWTSSTWQLDI